MAITKRPEPPPLVEVQFATFSCVTYCRSVLLSTRPDAVVTVGGDLSDAACVRWNELCSRLTCAYCAGVSSDGTLPPAYGTGSVAVA